MLLRVVTWQGMGRMQQKAHVRMCFSILLSDAQKAEKATHVSSDLESLVVCNVSSEQQLRGLKTAWQWKSFDVHEERTVVMRQGWGVGQRLGWQSTYSQAQP